MKSASFSQWIRCLLLAAIVFLGGCAEEQTEVPIPEGTPVDVDRLTTFSNPRSTVGDLVYVPVYSSVFHRSGERVFLATVTLSIHNVDLTDSIKVTDVAYFNTEGRRIREFARSRCPWTTGDETVRDPRGGQHGWNRRELPREVGIGEGDNSTPHRVGDDLHEPTTGIVIRMSGDRYSRIAQKGTDR